MKWLVRAVTVLFVLCLSLLAVVAYETFRSGHGTTGLRLVQSAYSPQDPVGEFTPLAVPRPAPAAGFTTLGGEPVNLRAFRGRMVLVNLWATWCGPCIEEMPSLQRMQAKLGPDLTVLAVSEDRGGAPVVEAFLAKLRLDALAVYLDPETRLTQAFGARGLPTSVLIDRRGRILGELEGAAQWDAPAMLALLRQYAKPPASPLEKASATR